MTTSDAPTVGALLAAAAMSAGAVAASEGLHPLIAFAAFAAGLVLLAVAPRWGDATLSPRPARAAVALATVAAVADRHLLVSSSVVAPDDVLAAIVVVGAFVLPRGPRWAAVGVATVLATYVMAGAALIAAIPYRSDAVVSAHGAADLVLAGRDPYQSFDLVEQLARFGLPPEFATPLEDGRRVRTLQYPALEFLVPAPLIAAGLADVRALYLGELIAVFGLLVLAAPRPARALALATCVGSLAVLRQFVAAGIDPLWALLALAAWLTRRHAASAVLLGLAVATRQQAWLIAPFVLAWAWRELGGREAAVRTAAVAATAAAIHVPFLLADPASLIGGLLDSALLPLEPWGVGPAKLLADLGLGALVPREAYTVAAGAAYIVVLGAYVVGRSGGRGALVLPLLPLWLSYRALQSYFAFIPLFATLDGPTGAQTEAQARSSTRAGGRASPHRRSE